MYSIIMRWLAGHWSLATAFWRGERNLWREKSGFVLGCKQNQWHYLSEKVIQLSLQLRQLLPVEVLYGIMLSVPQVVLSGPEHRSALGGGLERDWKWRWGAAWFEDSMSDLRGTENAEACALILAGLIGLIGLWNEGHRMSVFAAAR